MHLIMCNCISKPLHGLRASMTYGRRCPARWLPYLHSIPAGWERESSLLMLKELLLFPTFSSHSECFPEHIFFYLHSTGPREHLQSTGTFHRIPSLITQVFILDLFKILWRLISSTVPKTGCLNMQTLRRERFLQPPEKKACLCWKPVNILSQRHSLTVTLKAIRILKYILNSLSTEFHTSSISVTCK